MKVSLQPSPIQSISVGGAINVNQSNQLLMPSLNRSQSQYLQSPKMNVSTHQQVKKLSIALRSPGSDHSNTHLGEFETGNIGKNLLDEFNNERKFTGETVQQQHPHSSLKRFFKFSLQNENIYFLVNSKYGNWFSWCQSCKHGGHVKHLIDWFRTHQKCPFLHCKCCCISIDYSY
jgi:hypothetical protein